MIPGVREPRFDCSSRDETCLRPHTLYICVYTGTGTEVNKLKVIFFILARLLLMYVDGADKHMGLQS